MKAILTLGVATVALAVFAGILVDRLGVLETASALGAVASLTVGVVVVLFNDWGARGKTR